MIVAECEAPAPESAAAALDGVEGGASERIGYREEVYHPALLRPEITLGEMSVEPDGRLVRRQIEPDREVAILGEETVTVIGESGGAVEVLPVPSELLPFVATLRTVALGDTAALAGREALSLRTDPGGWRVPLGDGDFAPVLFGCGPRLRGIEIATGDGGARTIRFIDAP